MNCALDKRKRVCALVSASTKQQLPMRTHTHTQPHGRRRRRASGHRLLRCERRSQSAVAAPTFASFVGQSINRLARTRVTYKVHLSSGLAATRLVVVIMVSERASKAAGERVCSSKQTRRAYNLREQFAKARGRRARRSLARVPAICQLGRHRRRRQRQRRQRLGDCKTTGALACQSGRANSWTH